MKVGVASASSSAMTALIASGGLSNSASRRSSVASDAMVVGGRIGRVVGRHHNICPFGPPAFEAARSRRRANCKLPVSRNGRKIACSPPARTMTRVVDQSKIRRIWLRAPNWLGDFVMATATFARVRAAFPSAHLTVGLRPYLRPLLSGAKLFDEVVDNSEGQGPDPRSLAAGRALCAPDTTNLAIVLPNSLATGLVPFLARVPLRLGYKLGAVAAHESRPALPAMRRGLLDRRTGPRRWPTPMPSYYHDLLDVIGLPAGGEHPQLAVTEAAESVGSASICVRLASTKARSSCLLVVGAKLSARASCGCPNASQRSRAHFQERRSMRAARSRRAVGGRGSAKRIAAEGGANRVEQARASARQVEGARAARRVDDHGRHTGRGISRSRSTGPSCA
jgi:hypothetical protein